MSYYGSQYGCNPKYLGKHVANEHPEWRVVWAFNHPERYRGKVDHAVRYMSLRFFYELSTSKVIITNYRMPAYFRKRAGQHYVQTWHSSLRLKMIEKDVERSLPEHYVAMAKNDSRNIDLLLSGCEKSTDIFRGCFWYDGEIMPSGTPRNDLFFAHNREKVASGVRERLHVNDGCRIMLYAPTFRKDESLECYRMDYNAVRKSLEDATGNEWCMLARLHPHLLNKSSELFADGSVTDVTGYDDIQELLLVADVLVTDYSSLMFDYASLMRPCFLYTPDLDNYQRDDRSFYFNLNELPFPVCETSEELVRAIEGFDRSDYSHRLEQFLNTIGSYEDGHASERLTKRMEEWMK